MASALSSARVVGCYARRMFNFSTSRRFFASWMTAAEQMPPAVAHRSNAEALVAKVPVIEVAGTVALCDGGGGSMGHPIEYIKLDKREGHSASVCNYCGLRYKMAAGSHH